MVKIKKKHIILSCVVVLLAGIMIALNILASTYWGYLMYMFGDAELKGGERVEGALATGDELVQEVAEESMVLLKNENNTLPLAADNRKINLFGYGSTDLGLVYSGGGAGANFLTDGGSNKYKRNLTQAFEEEGFEVNKDLVQKYDDYSDYCVNPYRGIGSIVCPPADFYTSDVLRGALNFSDTAAVVISRNGTESYEIPLYQPKTGNGVSNDNTRTYLQLTTEEEAMIDVVADNFEKVIVLINSTNRMELGFLDDERIDAAIYMGAPGQSGTLAVPRILKGEKTVKDESGADVTVPVTPSGKLSDTYAYSTREYDPTDANMFANPQYPDHGEITYAENIYVGYRWYETADAEGYFDDVTTEYGSGYDGVVQYPFGHGLSYTDFSWKVNEVSVEEGSSFDEKTKFTFKVEVENIGEKAGKDVVQLYSTPTYYDGEIEKSEVNLVAFAKTKQLEPGQTQELELTFTGYDLASYDCYDANKNGHSGYELDRGDYTISLRTDAHTLKDCEDNQIIYTLDSTVNIDKDPVTNVDVVNRFTGEDAYMDLPIDASTLAEGTQFMSRADFEATFPKERSIDHRSEAKAQEVNTKWNTRYDVESDVTVNDEDNGLYFVTKEDGSPASYDDLTGATGATLKYNEELMLKLGNDYDNEDWDKLLNQMSESELRDIVYGGGFQTAAVASIGKPKTTDADGTGGIKYGEDNEKLLGLPTESLIGCCWSQETAYNVGRATGMIANAVGVQGWYAPGLNLHRNAYSGRYYEYYSEDPVLTGKLGAETIRGAKNLGLTCYMKHFAVSEEGVNPDNVMTWHTEQMLREIYLRAFEIPVKEGGANGIMTSFNCIGAVWAGACDPMNNDILRGEWGFDGGLLSDWSGGRPWMNVELAIRGGNDFMLDPSNNGGSSSMDINNPTTEARCRVSAHNILYMWANSWAQAKDYQENGEDDRYSADLGVSITQFPFSPIPVVLLVVADVILAGTIVACIVFIVKKPKDKNVRAE